MRWGVAMVPGAGLRMISSSCYTLQKFTARSILSVVVSRFGEEALKDIFRELLKLADTCESRSGVMRSYPEKALTNSAYGPIIFRC